MTYHTTRDPEDRGSGKEMSKCESLCVVQHWTERRPSPSETVTGASMPYTSTFIQAYPSWIALTLFSGGLKPPKVPVSDPFFNPTVPRQGCLTNISLTLILIGWKKCYHIHFTAKNSEIWDILWPKSQMTTDRPGVEPWSWVFPSSIVTAIRGVKEHRPLNSSGQEAVIQGVMCALCIMYWCPLFLGGGLPVFCFLSGSSWSYPN